MARLLRLICLTMVLVAINSGPAQAYNPSWAGDPTVTCATGAISGISAVPVGARPIVTGWAQPCIPLQVSGPKFGFLFYFDTYSDGLPDYLYHPGTEPTTFSHQFSIEDWSTIRAICLAYGIGGRLDCRAVTTTNGMVVFTPIPTSDSRLTNRPYVWEDPEDPECATCL
jgi:hypothetical protein